MMIYCNKCGARTGRADRCRIKWPAEGERRPQWDLCGECTDGLLRHLGLPPAEPVLKLGPKAR